MKAKQASFALAAPNDNAVLDAGAAAAFSTAAAVSLLALGANLFQAWDARQALADTTPLTTHAAATMAETTALAPIETEQALIADFTVADLPAIAAAPPLAATPAAIEITPPAPALVETPAPSPPALEDEPASAPEILAFRDDLMVLNVPRAFADPQPFGARTPRVETSTGDRLRAAAEGAVNEWQAPRPSERDLALFIASDDTSVSWSLSEQSANYGGMTYQEDRVEIGEIVAGIAVQTDDSALALAYVQHEIPTRFGSQEESYAGVVLTIKR